MKQTRLFIFCIGLGIMASCGVTKPASLTDISNTTWELDHITGMTKEQLPQPATLSFEDGKVSGFLGCNNFSGNMDLDDQSVLFSELKGTMKACSVGSVTENHLLNAMTNATSMNIVKGMLQLRKGKEVLAQFKRSTK